MILEQLVSLAEREGLMDDVAFQPQDVPYLLVLDRDGRLVSVQSTLTPAPGKKGRLEAKHFPVPVAGKKRTVNIAPVFLCDTATYVLGADPAGDTKNPERIQVMHQAFADLVHKAARETGDAGLVAVESFLSNSDEKAKVSAELAQRYAGPDAKNLPRDPRMTFLLDEDIETLVCNRAAVRAWWTAHRAGASDADEEPAANKKRGKAAASAPLRCLVTGELADPPDAHPAIKRVPSGQPAGCALVSFNQKAFESYGLESFANAPMSRHAAEAYARALNRLLDPAHPDPRHDGQVLPSRRFNLTSDTAVVFWASEHDEAVDLFASVFDSPNPDAVKELLRSPHRGKLSAPDDPKAFYALTLSGSNARIVIRDWFETTVANMLENMRAYFADITIASHKGEPMPLWRLLQSTAVQGKRENIMPGLAAAFFAAVLRGQPLPRKLLETALLRARAERFVPEARAALIKAYLVRARRMGRLPADIPEVTASMDESNTHPAYRLGRAFAVLEKAQVDAINPGKTIRDRYYGAASANPATVMPRLIRGAQPHFSKASSGSYLHQLLGKVLAPVEAFPATLTLEEQGLFALGYYHQNNALYTKRSAPSKDADTATATEEGGSL